MNPQKGLASQCIGERTEPPPSRRVPQPASALDEGFRLDLASGRGERCALHLEPTDKPGPSRSLQDGVIRSREVERPPRKPSDNERLW